MGSAFVRHGRYSYWSFELKICINLSGIDCAKLYSTKPIAQVVTPANRGSCFISGSYDCVAVQRLRKSNSLCKKYGADMPETELFISAMEPIFNNHISRWFNSPTSAAYMGCWTGSSMVQMIACRMCWTNYDLLLNTANGTGTTKLTFGNHHTSLSPGQYLKQGWFTHNRTKKNQLRWHQNQITKNMYLKMSLPNVEYFLMASVCWNCFKEVSQLVASSSHMTMRYGRSREQSIVAHWSNTYCSVECPRHWRATKKS